ncbi:hypothetical protein [Actinomyces trachealis]|uniref:hypothetical protein n=1 Tax=Actinomyces trachealis TaxID=2763540 RepID=UPI0018C69E49|nr:hypothetical protein [Actinomyces trachealis]
MAGLTAALALALLGATPATALVSNGGNVGGSAYISSILHDQSTIDVLNAMGLDVTSAGNHEFDQGVSDLGGRLTAAFNAPILSANVTGNAALGSEGDSKGVFIKEVKGLKVGFMGVVTDELLSLVAKSTLEGLSIANALETANARASGLKDSNQIAVIQPDHYGLKVGQISLSYDSATKKVTP